MIYVITNKNYLFESDKFSYISVADAISKISSWDLIQFDLETSGRDPHVCQILCAQFGNDADDSRIVLDCQDYPIELFKDLLESKLLVGQNLKFDLQFCYKHNIIPTKIWDTMIVEQLLHLGYNNKFFRYSLHDIAMRRLQIDLDKSVRGEIIWRGFDEEVIIYAANDVTYLEQIKNLQEIECKEKTCIVGAKLENSFVPVIAYLEWCGIKLDEKKWKDKMDYDLSQAEKAKEALNEWVRRSTHPEIMKLLDPQLDLFSDVRKVLINWSSTKQCLPVFKLLGFNVNTIDKETGKSKESLEEKVLKNQKGVNDEFLKLFLDYQETQKKCSTYGDQYLNSIHPITGRIHSTFKQLGAASGRMSCGSSQANTDASSLKGKKVIYPQLQNLPSDKVTRSAFVPEESNLMCSCDYSAMESRLGADIYNEPEMIKEYLEGSGDIHSLVASICFKDELEGIPIKDIKKLRPDLRSKAKGPEFASQFGGGARAIAQSIGCSMKEAEEIAEAYKQGFKGITTFKEVGGNLVKQLGYVLMTKATGHKMYWEDWKKWKNIDSFPDYEAKNFFTKKELDEHRKAEAKWERMALNAPTQGSGAVIIKYACILFFKWILQNNYFNKVLLCNIVHDEVVIEFPKELESIAVPKLVELMETASSKFCKKLPIPAEPSTGDHWIH